MTKKEIAKAIAEKLELPGVTVLEAVQMLFDGVTETLVQEGGIELRNFGIFQVKKREPRKARNPRTGEAVMVPSRNVVVFKPGLEMLERVRGMKEVVVSVETRVGDESTLGSVITPTPSPAI